MRKLAALAVVVIVAITMFVLGSTTRSDDHTSTSTQYRASLKSAGPKEPSPTTQQPATTVGESLSEIHSEEDPELEPSELYPISSNIDETEFPLRQLSDLAVGVLQAELTGQGRESYPHLDGQTQPCCKDLQIAAAVVIFGQSGEPVKVSLEWTATLLGSEEKRTETAPSLWWRQPDGTMKGDHEK